MPESYHEFIVPASLIPARRIQQFDANGSSAASVLANSGHDKT
jgi:hypothetical protein